MTDTPTLPPLPEPLPKPLICGHCLMEITHQSGLRYFGTSVAHQEYECLRLLHAEIERLTAEVAESDALRDKLADILKRTAIALRGPEPPLTRWSWHNLPELVEQKDAEIERLTAEVAAAEADARRFNWLERAFFERHWNGVVGPGGEYHWNTRGDWRHAVQKLRGKTMSLRDAIDAAQKKKP